MQTINFKVELISRFDESRAVLLENRKLKTVNFDQKNYSLHDRIIVLVQQFYIIVNYLSVDFLSKKV